MFDRTVRVFIFEHAERHVSHRFLYTKALVQYTNVDGNLQLAGDTLQYTFLKRQHQEKSCVV